MADEHEVYGAEIPEYDEDDNNDGKEFEEIEGGQSGGEQVPDMEEVRNKLKEIEEEAAALREMQAKLEIQMQADGGGNNVNVSAPGAVANNANTEKKEVDARSIYVGNVDYTSTSQQVQQHFQSCGTVNRVTIVTDAYGHPKGFAYLEFLEKEAVENALALNESQLQGRQVKVARKRTNVPGMKQNAYQGSRFNPYMRGAARYRPPRPPYGYGKAPRYRPFYGYYPY